MTGISKCGESGSQVLAPTARFTYQTRTLGTLETSLILHSRAFPFDLFERPARLTAKEYGFVKNFVPVAR